MAKKPKTTVPIVDLDGELARSVGQGIKVTPAQLLEVATANFKYHNEKYKINAEVRVLPQDGGQLLYQVLKRRYGFVKHGEVAGEAGSVEVELGPGENVSVPWGDFSVAQLDGTYFLTRGGTKDDTPIFRIAGEAVRKWEDEVDEIINEVRELAKTHSIYRGRTMRVSFQKSFFGVSPELTPVDVSGADENNLCFDDDLSRDLLVSVLTPIKLVKALKKMGERFARKLLFAGPFGTGKTEFLRVVAKYANALGVTVFYAETAEDAQRLIRLARLYSPYVVVIEDLDRVTNGERTVEMDALMNILDGMETKDDLGMVVATTNRVEVINPGVVRRFSDVVEFRRPDAPTVERLVRLFAGNILESGTSLTLTGQLMSGRAPSLIKEVVSRAKMAAAADEKATIDATLLEWAARKVQRAADLVDRPQELAPSDIQVLGKAVGDALSLGFALATQTDEKCLGHEHNTALDELSEEQKRAYLKLNPLLLGSKENGKGKALPLGGLD